MSDSDSASGYSPYGIYTLKDQISLKFPNVSIKFEKTNDNSFSYYREGPEGSKIEKIIPFTTNELEIEVAPIRPLNYPAQRTEHVFLKSEVEVFLQKESGATELILCPIEIGIFVGKQKDSLDAFTCDPLNSRFGLFGKSDSGKLCKYYVTKPVSSMTDSTPYVNGVIKVTLKNEGDGVSLDRVVFQITRMNVYYKESKAIFDGMRSTIEKEVKEIEIVPIETDWTKSPSWEEVKSSRFSFLEETVSG